jgi:opacity protein-like surface antigen
MKHFILFLLVLLTIPAAGQAQGPSVRFGIHGNIINADLNATLSSIAGTPAPSGPSLALQEIYGLGLGGGLHLDVGLGLLTLRVSGDYIRLAPDKEKFSSYVNSTVPGIPLTLESGGIINLWSGTVNAKLVVLPLPIVKPYVTGGIGLTYVNTTDVTLKFNNSNLPAFRILQNQTDFTDNIGAGVDILLGPITLYGEVKVTWIFLKEGTSTYVPIGLVGISF